MFDDGNGACFIPHLCCFACLSWCLNLTLLSDTIMPMAIHVLMPDNGDLGDDGNEEYAWRICLNVVRLSPRFMMHPCLFSVFLSSSSTSHEDDFPLDWYYHFLGYFSPIWNAPKYVG
jgi:hypothetical protein